jgi:uncharacterized protein with gpF-like domain
VGASADVWQDVRQRTVVALRDGMGTDELREEIVKVSGYSEVRAEAIARTEAMSAYNAGDLQGARALGEFGPVEKVWIAALDQRTRPDHAEAHNQVVALNEPFDIGGEPMMRPGEGSAANVVNCRCVMEFLYEGDARPDGSLAGS